MNINVMFTSATIPCGVGIRRVNLWTARHLPLCCPFTEFFVNRVSTEAYSDSCGSLRNSSSLIHFLSQLQEQIVSHPDVCRNLVLTNRTRNVLSVKSVMPVSDGSELIHRSTLKDTRMHCTQRDNVLAELELNVCVYWRSHHPTYSILGSAATATESFSMCSALSSFGCSCSCRH